MGRFLAVLLLAVLCSTQARADFTFAGSASLRRLIQQYNDGLSATDSNNNDQSQLTRQRWEYRASLGAYSTSSMVDWGVEMRTQPTGSANTEWQAFNQGTATALSLGQAYGRLHGNTLATDWGFTVGRQKPVFLTDNVAQALFGNPVRFDGFGETFKHGMFGFNMAQYIQGAESQGTPGASTYTSTAASDAGAQTQSHIASLLVFQPYITFDITQDISSLFAVGYYDWSNTQGNATSSFFNNAVHGGQAGTSAGGTFGDQTAVNMNNARQVQLLSDTSLPWNLRLVGEYIRNKNVNYGALGATPVNPVAANRNAYAASLVYGKLKHTGDFTLQYSYSNKGIASVMTYYTNVDVGADNISHMFLANVLVADRLSLTGKWQFHKEQSGLDGAGAPDAPRFETYQRIEFFANLSY